MYVSLSSLLAALDPTTIAQRVELPHDEARAAYRLDTNTVGDFRAFEEVLEDYCRHHQQHCVTPGGTVNRVRALGIAKEVLTRDYSRRGGDLVSAYNDAHYGTNGGLRALLDKLAEAFKLEAVEQYVRDAFDRHVAPNSRDERVEIIRQFIAQCAGPLKLPVRAHQPEDYARDYEPLIRTFVEGLRRSTDALRRL